MFLILLALIVVACMKRRGWARHASWSWSEHHGRHGHDGSEAQPSDEQRFEEWHRRVHGREHEADDNERV